MSLGNNIKSLREQVEMTQQDLANLLHVTPQAVSRWETNQVEPSIDTLIAMGKIFDVSVDQLINGASASNADEDEEEVIQEEIVEEEREEIVNESAPTPEASKPQVITQPIIIPVVSNKTEVNEAEVVEQIQKTPEIEPTEKKIGNCHSCGEDIYSSNYGSTRSIGRRHRRKKVLYCKGCHERREIARIEHLSSLNKKARTKGFIWGGVIALAVLIIGIILLANQYIVPNATSIIILILTTYATFAFVFNLYAKNNFIEDVFLVVFSWGFVKMPGLIFSLSLGGIAWLIVVKIIFAIIAFLIGATVGFAALLIGMALSMFVFPFALYWSIKKPEKYSFG